MSRLHASQDGWIRISAGAGAAPAVSGQARFFKGYAVDGGDGVFAKWDWDGERLRASTCATGFLPLYYYADGQQAVLATSIAGLFAASGKAPRICPASLGVLLRLGFLVGDHTPFEGVRLLGPQGTLTWRPGGGPEVSSSYLQVQETRADHARESYAALFRASMERIAAVMAGDFAVPLSGGRDSRHIALELYRMGCTPRFALTARHLPPRNDEDVRVASELCGTMRWPHRVVRQPVLGQYAQECAHAQAVDFMTYEHAWTMPVRAALHDSGVAGVFDGVGGDVLSAGLFQDEQLLGRYLDGDIESVRRGLLASWSQLGGEDALEDTLGPLLAGACTPGAAEELIDAELRRHLGQPNPLKSFYFWNRSRRGTGLLPFRILSRHVAYAPYLDRTLLAFLLGLPPGATRDKRLHTDAIAIADPVIGAIPYEDKHARAPRQRLSDRVAFYAPMIARSMTSGGYVNGRFVAPRAARACLLGGDLQSTWWKPRRVAYLASLARFVHQFNPDTRTQGTANYAFNDR
ncbi:hypothetical protein [Pseudoduganella sp. GCM10020061]|uniref:hypothetical protein n=1 Tax=Pseudoduganella sp. GCM10020061 TaxID=3317345 RepID=UPI0036255B7F